MVPAKKFVLKGAYLEYHHIDRMPLEHEPPRGPVAPSPSTVALGPGLGAERLTDGIDDGRDHDGEMIIPTRAVWAKFERPVSFASALVMR